MSARYSSSLKSINDALALKANESTVNNALALKANESTVNNALALKANATAAAIGALVAGVEYNQIGSVVLGVRTTTGTTNPNGVVSGSLIRPVSISTTDPTQGGPITRGYGATLAGSWRVMGYSYDDSAGTRRYGLTVFVRVA